MELPTRILAIRHGETDWNLETRIQGQLDIPLNERGRWQASQLSQAVLHEGLSAVYSSDLLRAQETAQWVLRGAGLSQLNLDAGLRERGFGVFEGHTYQEIEARWPGESERWRKREPDFGAEGGETLCDFYARCVAAASRLASAHPGESIALVTHGGVLDCLYRAATRVDLQAPRTWKVGNAGINRLLHTPQGFILVGWGDNGHLDPQPEDDLVDRVGHAA